MSPSSLPIAYCTQVKLLCIFLMTVIFEQVAFSPGCHALTDFHLSHCLELSPIMKKMIISLGEQRWRSGEGTCLPPMWPRFESWTLRQMWVEFVVGSRPCSERFLSGTFPIRSQHISGRRATLWMIPICLFFVFYI